MISLAMLRSRIFKPQLVLSVFLLAMYSLINPTHNPVVVVSEAIFPLIAGFFVSDAILHGKRKHTKRNMQISLLLLPTFAIVVFSGRDSHQMQFSWNVKKDKMVKILQNLVSMGMALLACNYCKVFNNKVETNTMLRKSKHHLGPGMARTFFR
jgi:hypothetical protein